MNSIFHFELLCCVHDHWSQEECREQWQSIDSDRSARQVQLAAGAPGWTGVRLIDRGPIGGIGRPSFPETPADPARGARLPDVPVQGAS